MYRACHTPTGMSTPERGPRWVPTQRSHPWRKTVRTIFQAPALFPATRSSAWRWVRRPVWRGVRPNPSTRPDMPLTYGNVRTGRSVRRKQPVRIPGQAGCRTLRTGPDAGSARMRRSGGPIASLGSKPKRMRTSLALAPGGRSSFVTAPPPRRRWLHPVTPRLVGPARPRMSRVGGRFRRRRTRPARPLGGGHTGRPVRCTGAWIGEFAQAVSDSARVPVAFPAVRRGSGSGSARHSARASRSRYAWLRNSRSRPA